MVFEDNLNNRELKITAERKLGCVYDPYICEFYGSNGWFRRELEDGDEGKGEKRERDLWWWRPPTSSSTPTTANTPPTSGTCTSSQENIENLKNYPTQSGVKNGSMYEFWVAQGITQISQGEEACLPCVQCTLTWDWCNNV